MATAVGLSTVDRTRVPVEVYLRTLDYEPDCEFVDGVIEERPMGEWDHTSWQQALQQWFLLHSREWNIRVRAEQRVQVSATRYRVPDVVVVHTPVVVEQIVTRPLIAVFEVLSPEDRMPRILVKLRDYQAMGIPTIVVIHTATKTIYQYRNGSLEVFPGRLLLMPGCACSVDWDRVEEFLD